MIKELVALANKLDSLGLYKEADLIDLNLEKFLKSAQQNNSSSSESPYPPPPESPIGKLIDGFTTGKRVEQPVSSTTAPTASQSGWDAYIKAVPRGVEVKTTWENYAATMGYPTSYSQFQKWWKGMKDQKRFKYGGSVEEVLDIMNSYIKSHSPGVEAKSAPVSPGNAVNPDPRLRAIEQQKIEEEQMKSYQNKWKEDRDSEEVI